jgi:hypothetical protein
MTSLNFQVDKTIFFGYEEVMADKRTITERFLKKYCHVKEVAFYTFSDCNLQSILKTMRTVIGQEKAAKNEVFFDLTGGEDLLLIAFGMLAESFKAPMHLFDVESQKLTELNDEEIAPISQVAKARKIPLTLDGFIEMRGGVINYNLQKDVKKFGVPLPCSRLQRHLMCKAIVSLCVLKNKIKTAMQSERTKADSKWSRFSFCIYFSFTPVIYQKRPLHC